MNGRPSHVRLILSVLCALLLAATLWPHAALARKAGEDLSPQQFSALIDARNLLDAGRPDQAVERLLPPTRTEHPPLILLSHLAWAQTEAKDGRGALATYERAAKLYPDDARTMRNLGLLLLGQGRLAEAADTLERAYDLQPEDGREPALLAAAASIRARLKAYPAALALVTRAEQATDAPPVAWSSLAVYCCLRLDKPGEAVRRARECARNHADQAAAWQLLGRALARNGDPLGAAAALETADALRPPDAKDKAAAPDEIAALYALGHAHAEAARWLAESGSPDAVLREAERLYLTRQLKAALAALDRYQSSGGPSRSRADTLRAELLRGRILLDEGRTDQAVTGLLRAAKAPLDDRAATAEHRLRGSLLLLAGEARWMQRDWAGAARIFTALSTVPGFGRTGTSLAGGMRALISDAALSAYDPMPQPTRAAPEK